MKDETAQPLPIVVKLPAAYLQGIGLVMTTWARLEYELRDLVFFILDMDRRRGRTAIRAPRPKEIVEMAEELLVLDGITEIKCIDMVNFKSAIEDMEFRRNVFAHNIWLEMPDGQYLVQNLQGSWPKENGIRLRKRTHPEGKATKVEDINHVVERTLEAIHAVRLVRAEIAPQLQALREKRSAPDPA